MKPCLNCDEQTAFTVNAIGVDTEMCAPCFEANAVCCEWCDRLGSDEEMDIHEVIICVECIEREEAEARIAEDEFYASLQDEDPDYEAYMTAKASDQDEDYDYVADDLAYDAWRETR